MAQPTFEQVYPVLYKGWDRESARADFNAGNWTNKAGADQFMQPSGPVSSYDAAQQLERQFADILISIDEQIGQMPLHITNEERDRIMEQAVEEVAPYYEKKRKEIEKGIDEGKIRNAEDLLMEIRDVGAETRQKLERYDLEQAETEEELVDTLADLTATEEEELEVSKANWRDRVREAKSGQVQIGTLTSGVGRERIGELIERQQMEQGTIQRRAESAKTDVERQAKYDKQAIALARRQAEEDRVRRIGGPEATEETVGKLLNTTGYGTMGELPSDVELARLRSERDVTPYSPTALTDLEERQKIAQEKMRQELEQEELSLTQQEWEQRKRDILSREAKEHKDLATRIYGLG